MAKISGAVTITGLLAPSDTNDTYPITDPIYGVDGLRNVADITERNSIPYDRRRLGMLVSIERSGSPQELDSNGNPIYDIYQLVNEPGSGNNTSDSDWKLMLDSTNIDQESAYTNNSTQLTASNPDTFRGKIKSLFQPKSTVLDLSTNLTASDIVFNGEGTIAIIKIIDENQVDNAEVRKYNLSTPFDVSTATYANESYQLNNIKVRSIDMTLDGTKLYEMVISPELIIQHNLSSPFDLTTASDSGNSVDTNNLENLTAPKTVRVSSDGSKLYFCGASPDANEIYQYSMTSGDLSSISRDGAFSPSNNTVKAFDFSSKYGHILFISNRDDSLIYKYYLDNSFDITSNTTSGETLDVINIPISTLQLSHNGKYLYYISSNTGSIIQSLMTAPYDLNTSTVQGVSISSNSSALVDIVFAFGGLKAFELDNTNQLIREIDVSFPYELANFNYTGNTFSTSDTNPQAIEISLDGSKLYELGASTEIVYEYDFGADLDLTTLTYNGNYFDLANKISSALAFRDIVFHVYGRKLFVLSNDSNGAILHKLELSSNWDITTAQLNDSQKLKTYNVSKASDSTMITFKSDGSGFYEADKNSIYEYILTRPWDITSLLKITSVDWQSVTPNSIYLTYDYSKLYYTTNSNAIYEGLLGIKFPNNLLITGEGRVYHLGSDISYGYELTDKDVTTVIQTQDYTITQENDTILVDASNGLVTLTLPSTISTFRKPYFIKKIDSTSNAVTFAPTSPPPTEIEFGNNISLTTQGDSVILQHNQSDWYTF